MFEAVPKSSVAPGDEVDAILDVEDGFLDVADATSDGLTTSLMT